MSTPRMIDRSQEEAGLRAEQIPPPGAAEPRVTIQLEALTRFRITILAARINLGTARQYEQDYNLNLGEWRILALVGRSAPITAAVIADRYFMDKGQISRTVRQLIERGLLVCSGDSEDARRTLLWLSREGAALHDRIVPVSIERERIFMETLTPAECDQLEVILNKLERQFETPDVDTYIFKTVANTTNYARDDRRGAAKRKREIEHG